MSASVKMLSNKMLSHCFRVCSANNCVRGLKRNPTAVYSVEEERQQLKNRNIRHDPKKNPYSNFELSDPVQKNLVGLARQKKKPPVLKSPAKSYNPRSQQLQQGGHMSFPGIESQKGGKTATSQTYIKLTDSDKKFG